MFDELPAKIVGFEVVVGPQRVDNPHLVASAAGGNVEPLFEEFLITQRQGSALCSVNEGDKNDVAFIALELCGIAAQQAMTLVSIR
jgi:hypothetical protein